MHPIFLVGVYLTFFSEHEDVCISPSCFLQRHVFDVWTFNEDCQILKRVTKMNSSTSKTYILSPNYLSLTLIDAQMTGCQHFINIQLAESDNTVRSRAIHTGCGLCWHILSKKKITHTYLFSPICDFYSFFIKHE